MQFRVYFHGPNEQKGWMIFYGQSISEIADHIHHLILEYGLEFQYSQEIK